MSFLLWSRLRNYLYDRNILSTVGAASSYVISVGNLTWGGTGKTAFVLGVSEFLIANGLRVAIVSRGYGRKTCGPVLVSDGSNLKCSWEESGDEAYLLAKSVPGAVVAVSEKRSEGFAFVEQFSPDVILLDDAFQHRKVKRDLDLVLIDASEDITAQKVIPFGKLREEPDSLQRSDAVILTHYEQANPKTMEWVTKSVRVPLFHANYVRTGEPSIRGKKIAALCAIGAPHHFHTLLRDQEAEIVASRSFRDHHVFTSAEIQEFRRLAAETGADFIVTTAKDAVRMDPSWLDPFLRVVHVKLQIVEEALFFEFLLNAIHRVPQKQISQS